MQVVPGHCQIHLQSYLSLEQGERELSFERDQSITRASSRLRPSIRDLFDSNTFRFGSLPIPSLRDSIVLLPLFHIRIIAFSFLENGRRIHENTVIRSRERESSLPLCCQGKISVEIWDSTFASVHVKFSWERKFTSRRFQIRLEGLRITWLRENVLSFWPVDKLLDGRSRGRGSWQESGLKSYLTIPLRTRG